MDDLSVAELRRIGQGHCPDCNHRGFVIGPMQGGGVRPTFSTNNIECGNLACRSRFNVGFYASAVTMGHRIEKQSEGGHPWASDPDQPQPEGRAQ